MFQAKQYPTIPRETTLAQLPAEYGADAQDQISQILNSTAINRLVVLDDDPTGTQTCHDISVLTVWDLPTLITEFKTNSPGFFILTNSRALPPNEASKLIQSICENVLEAANSTNNKVDVVLRGDSTLRGHFPLEPDVAQSVFGPADALVLAPFFFQGGRFTIDDVHYVAEGDKLVPAGATQFAKDATFGYQSSNLRDYVLEKAPGRFNENQLHSVTIDEIRRGGPEAVCQKLLATPTRGVVIANAAAESDMHVFVAGLLLGIIPFSQLVSRTSETDLSSRIQGQTFPLPYRSSLRLDQTRHSLESPHLRSRASPSVTPRDRRTDRGRFLRAEDDSSVESPHRSSRINGQAGNHRDKGRRTHRIT